MENINLDDCKLITSRQYCELSGTPEYKGQTKLDNNNMYYMVFEHENVMYKILNRL